MIKKILISSILFISLISNSFSAGSSDTGSKNTLYDKAVNLINVAKKNGGEGKVRKGQEKISKSPKIFNQI